METDQFEKYIKEAVLMVPKHLRNKMENLAFVVEDRVRPATMKERGINFRGMILGLYQGVPKSRRGVNYSWVLPDKITIFKNPIEKLGRFNEEKIRQLIHQVVHHEIAHYFGMNEQEVRTWERRRN